MSLNNYGDMKQKVADTLSRNDLTGQIPDFIAGGEDRLYADLRVRFMEASIAVAILSGAQTSGLPDRYLQTRSLYVMGSPNQRLEFRTEQEFWSIYASLPSGKPRVFTVEGENFVWAPTPDQNYTASIVYYKRPDALSADSDTNGLFTLAPRLLLYASLIETGPHLGNDPRTLVWSALYDDLLQKVHLADRRDRYSGDAQLDSRQAQMT